MPEFPHSWFRRALILVTLALSALFLARGTSELLADALLPPASSGDMAGSEAADSEPIDINALLARNIFDPTTGPLWPPRPPPPPPAPAPLDDDPRDCESSLRLVASIFSEDAPHTSLVSLKSEAGVAQIYREGGSFAQGEIEAIYPQTVVLRGRGRSLCSIDMFGGPSASKGPASANPSTSSRGTFATPERGTAQAFEDAIEQHSDTRFTVQRQLVDALLSGDSTLMRPPRIVPHEKGGRLIGVKMYGIRQNSPLGKLGLQNGDLLHSINGYDMATPDGALEAYSRLRNASNLSASITRRCKPISLEYEIE